MKIRNCSLLKLLGFLLFTQLVFGCRSNEVVYQNQYTISDMKGGRIVKDSSYIYNLPYLPGEKYRLVQAYHSKHLSHQNEFSLDFKMKEGTSVCAAREGLVISIKEDSDEGGIGDEYLAKGNFVEIEHKDGTIAGYWHLQKESVPLEVGQNVKKGDLIGKSGNTGYSAFPHLHFWVYRIKDGERKTIPCRFKTRSGIHYLRPGGKYKRIK